MSIILSNCQHYDEQQFQTLSCVHYTISSVIKLDVFIRAVLLDRILAFRKNYAYASRTSCLFYSNYDKLHFLYANGSHVLTIECLYDCLLDKNVSIFVKIN